jgi:hypothetical protein
MTDEELRAIRARAERSPGGWSSDRCGAPVLHKSYGMDFIDHFLFKDPDVYVRQKRSEKNVLDQLPRFAAIAQRIDKFLQSAYQAHADVQALLKELDRYRARDSCRLCLQPMAHGYCQSHAVQMGVDKPLRSEVMGAVGSAGDEAPVGGKEEG